MPLDLLSKWQNAGLFPWLQPCTDSDGTDCLQCILCPAANAYRIHTGKLHKGHAIRHEKSTVHSRLADRDASSTGGVTKLSKIQLRSLAPPFMQFDKVLSELKKGPIPTKGVEGIGAHVKISHMRACLAEAIRRHHRSFFRKMKRPGCWALKRDESKHRLCLLFHAVDEKLQIRDGLLGWERCALTDAVGKTEQTRAAMKLFCTPRKGYLAVGKLDIALYRKLAALLEFMATDAASSELLSVKMMQRGVKLDGLDATAPNLRHTRDKVYGEQKQMQANTNTQRKLTLTKLAC